MTDLTKTAIPNISGSPITFLREVKNELTKVTWPTRNEVVKLTIIVIGISVAIGIYIGGLDLLFTKLTDLLVK